MLEQELQHVLGLSGCDWQDLNTSMDQRYTGTLKASGRWLTWFCDIPSSPTSQG